MDMEKKIESKLEKEGWHLLPQSVPRIVEHLQSGTSAKNEIRDLEGIVRTELLDTDIKHIGARCLPDAQSLSHTRILEGFWVLQILSVIDISQSSRRVIPGGNQQSRLLRFRLSDGHSTVTAIEFRPIPSVSEELPPGTKVVLGKSVPVHTGVLLLDVNCVRVLGGHVQTLYDAWEMDRKYSGVARETSRTALLPEGVAGPPPFRTLQHGRKSRPEPGGASHGNDSCTAADNLSGGMTTKGNSRIGDGASPSIKTEVVPGKPRPAIRPGAEPYRPRVGAVLKDASSVPKIISTVEASSTSMMDEATGSAQQPSDLQAFVDEKTIDGTPNPQQKASSALRQDVSAPLPSVSSMDLKVDDKSRIIDQNIRNAIALGIDTAPLQNRKAAQKLLDKSVDTDPRRGRGGRRGGRAAREREDDGALMTLDEWEAKLKYNVGNGSLRAPTGASRSGGSYGTDEELAWRLQQQFDLEEEPPKDIGAAEQLRLSMFNFTPGLPGGQEDTRGRGRGRGRGSGRGRGRGRRYG